MIDREVRAAQRLGQPLRQGGVVFDQEQLHAKATRLVERIESGLWVTAT
jgi:hypothetical protein